MSAARPREWGADRLYEVKVMLYDVVSRFFGGDPELYQYVRARLLDAYQVLGRRSSSYYSGSEYRSSVESSEGGEVYYVRVSEDRFKCTCQDAVMQSAAAEKAFAAIASRLGLDYSFARDALPQYSLCKHVIARLAAGLENGYISVTPRLRETLALAVFSAYLRASKRVDTGTFRRFYQLLRSRHGVR